MVRLSINGEPPGETGATAAVPAPRNAIYAATGAPLGRVPIDRKLPAARPA